jgi:protein CpxP
MKRNQFVTALVTLVLIVSASFMVVAGGHCGKGGGSGRGNGRGKGGHIMRMLMDLDLTDAQMTEVSSIMKEQCSDKKANREKMRELMKAKKDLVMTESFDEAAVRKNAEDVAAMQVEMMVKKAKVHNQIFNVLTDEQKAKLKTKMAEMKNKMEKMKEMRSKFKKHFGNQEESE